MKLLTLFLNLQLDLPFSIPFYRWLLHEDSSLGLSDLQSVAPEVQVTLKRLQNIVRERDEILSNPALDQETKNSKVCSIHSYPMYIYNFISTYILTHDCR